MKLEKKSSTTKTSKNENKEKNFDILTDFTASSNLKMDNRLERENLQRLFAIIIQFPFLFKSCSEFSICCPSMASRHQ